MLSVADSNDLLRPHQTVLMDVSRHTCRTLTGEHPVVYRIVGPVRIGLGGVSQYLNLPDGAAYTVQCLDKGVQNRFSLG